MKKTFKEILKWMGAEWWTTPTADLEAIVRVNGRFNFWGSYCTYIPGSNPNHHNMIGCDGKTIIFYDCDEELPYALDIADLLEARVTSIDTCSEDWPVIKISTNKVRQFNHHAPYEGAANWCDDEKTGWRVVCGGGWRRPIVYPPVEKQKKSKKKGK